MAHANPPSSLFLSGQSHAGRYLGGRRARSLLAVVAVLAVFVGGVGLDSGSAVAKVKRDGDPPFEIQDFARSGFLLDSAMPAECEGQGWGAEGALWASRYVGSAYVCFGALWDPQSPGDLSLLLGSPGFSGKFWNIYSEGKYFVLMFDIDNDPNDNTDAVRHICISFSPSWQGWEDCVFVRYDGQKYNRQLRVHEHRFSFAEAEFQAGGTVSNFSYLVLDDLADYVFGLAGRMPIVFDYYNGYRMTNDRTPPTRDVSQYRWCGRNYTYHGGYSVAPFAYEMCLTPAVDTGYGTPGKSGLLKVGISPTLKKILENNPSPIDHEITMNYAFIYQNGLHISRSSIIRCGSIVPAGDGHYFECDTRTSIYTDDSTLPKSRIVGIRMGNFTTAPPRPPSVRLVALEVTQGIQDWGNNLTLVKDRRTVVRAFIETLPGLQRSIAADLHGRKVSGGTLGKSSTPPVNSNESIIVRANVASRRGDIDASLNFVLPDEWASLSESEELNLELRFRKSVDSNCNMKTLYLPHNPCEVNVEFAEVAEHKIVMVPLLAEDLDGTVTPVPPEMLEEQFTRIMSLMPLPHQEYAPIGVTEFGLHPFTFGPFKRTEHIDNANYLVWQLKTHAVGMPGEDVQKLIYLGIMEGGPIDENMEDDKIVPAGSGLGFGTRAAGWYAGTSGEDLGADISNFGRNRHIGSHELGHVYNQEHPKRIYSGSSVEVCGRKSSASEEYPYFEQFELLEYKRDEKGEIESHPDGSAKIEKRMEWRPTLGPLGNSATEVWGLDVRFVDPESYAGYDVPSSVIVPNPYKVFSFMSYCDPVKEVDPSAHLYPIKSHKGQGQWMDAFHHELIIEFINETLGQVANQAVEYDSPVQSDLFTGYISFSSEDEPIEIEVFPIFSMLRFPQSDGSGEYTLELRDSSNEIVHSIEFATVESVSDPIPGREDSLEETKRAYFSVILPDPPEYTSFDVLKDGRKLSSISLSPNTPNINVSGPAQDQAFWGDDTIYVSWIGSDLDGDDLLYKLYYSVDGGASYELLSMDTTTTNVGIQASKLKGANEARIGVSVSDGTRSSFAETSVFSVVGHIPEIKIQTPKSGAVFAGSKGFLLDASGYDIEDGGLSSEAFRWTSNIDGNLGTGEFLVVSASDLTPGDHIITVSATDSEELTAYASVDITINSKNMLPVANDDAVPADMEGTILIDVLRNDIDIEGDFKLGTLTIGRLPQNGIAEVSYTAQERPLIRYSSTTRGPDSFSYFICDGLNRCDSAEVVVAFPECTITGTHGDDTLVGTSGDDVICGLGGNDTIDARAGNDIIDAGPGNDTIYGRDGDDTIYGRAGDDFILAHRGDDTIYGGPNNDIIYGGGGEDTVLGEDGSDELYGEADNDILYGNGDSDKIHGGRGNDIIYGGSGDDTIRGNAGSDILYLGPGADIPFGVSSEDTIYDS